MSRAGSMEDHTGQATLANVELQTDITRTHSAAQGCSPRI